MIEYRESKVYIRGTERDLEEIRHLAKDFSPGSSFLLQVPVVVEVLIDVVEAIDGATFEERFRNLFPEGFSTQHGKRFRGSPSKVKANLKRFKKEFKFDDDIILESTKAYIDKQIELGKKQYLPQAHFFVYHRDRGSELEAAIEAYIHGDLNEENDFWT